MIGSCTLRRELWRALSTRGPWLLITLALVAAVTTTVALAQLGAPPSSAASLAAIPMACAVFGAVLVGGDFQHATVHVEVLLAGSRWRYWARLGAAIAITAAASALACAGVTLMLSELLYHRSPSLPGAVLGGVVVAVAWGLLGAGLAAMIRHTAGAIAALLGYLIVAEPVFSATVGPRVSGFLPAATSADLLAWAGNPVRAMVTIILFASLSWLSGAAVLMRRDLAVSH